MVNLYGKKLNSVLGVPHSILKQYNPATLTEGCIKAIKQLISFGRLGQLTTERFKFIAKEVVTYNDSLGALDIFRTFGLEKVFNYLDRQAEAVNKKDKKSRRKAGGCGMQPMYPKANRAMMWRDFQDYRRQCHKLGHDLTNEGIMFPKDLHESHQRATEEIAEIQRIENEKKMHEKNAAIMKDFETAVKKYLKNQIIDGGLIFRICQTPQELTAEGNALHHCVGGYADRVAAKTCLIFFIRAANQPDKPYYTLEVNPRTNNIVQLRGFSNRMPPDGVQRFAEECVAQIQITQKETRERILVNA
jgi:hypothetical protein